MGEREEELLEDIRSELHTRRATDTTPPKASISTWISAIASVIVLLGGGVTAYVTLVHNDSVAAEQRASLDRKYKREVEILHGRILNYEKRIQQDMVNIRTQTNNSIKDLASSIEVMDKNIRLIHTDINEMVSNTHNTNMAITYKLSKLEEAYEKSNN